MAKDRIKTRSRGGKILTGIIAFLLGFIIALVAEVGAIIGAGWFFLNKPIDSIFAIFDLKNDDGDGNQIIATGELADGTTITTVMDLVEEIQALVGAGWNNITIDDIVRLSPALEAKLDEFCSSAEDYGVYLDTEELYSTPIKDMAAYFNDEVLMNIVPYELLTSSALEGTTGSLVDNPLMSKLLDGVEADTVADGDREYIVYYDEYVPVNGVYMRVVDGEISNTAYPDYLDPEEWLYETSKVKSASSQSEGEQASRSGDIVHYYRQYYYRDTSVSVSRYTVTYPQTDAEGNTAYGYLEPDRDNIYPAELGNAPEHYTGNYTYDSAGQKVYFEGMQVTLGMFLRSEDGDSSSGGIGGIGNLGNLPTLDFIEVTDLLGESTSESEVITSVFAGITLADLLSQEVDFDAQVKSFELSALLDDVSVDDKIMTYIVYGLSGLKEAEGGDYYTALYNYTDEQGNSATLDAIVYVNGDVVDRVVDAQTGEELPSVTVNDIGSLTQNLRVDIFMSEIDVNEPIFAYLAYGLTNVTATGSEGVYTAVCEYTDEDGNVHSDVPVTVYTHENGEGDDIIDRVVTAEGEEILSATVNDLTDRVNGITDTLTLGDLVPIAPSTTETNNNIIMFAAFSATMQPGELKNDASGSYYEGKYYPDESTEGEPAEYPARLYITSYPGDEGQTEEKITRVAYTTDDGATWLEGEKTGIDDIGSQISRITDVLTIGDILDIDPDDRLMTKLARYRLGEISNALDDIWISDAIDIAADEDLMLYIAFGITDVREQGGSLVATYHPLEVEEGGERTVTLVTRSDAEKGEIVVGIKYEDGEIDGTPISDVGERVERLTDDLTLSAVNISVEADSSIMMYIAYGVTNISKDDAGVITGLYTTAEGEVVVTVEADAEGNAERVYYVQNGTEVVEVSGTKIGNIGDQVSGITENLTVAELIGEDKIQNNRILSLVANSTISELPDTINSLSVQDMYADEIYEEYAVSVNERSLSATAYKLDPPSTYYTLD